MKLRNLLRAILCLFCVSAFGQYDASKLTSTMVKPQNIVKKGEGHYFIDFGKDAFGALVIKSEVVQSDSLIISIGEKLSAPNTIDSKPGGTIRYQSHVVDGLPTEAFKLSLRYDKRNEGDSRAIKLVDTVGRITPFRYCEVKNLKVPIESVSFTQQMHHYQFDDAASYFTSSDTVLNQVWDLCKHTIKATSFCGLYVDGDRERIPYEADAFINQLSHYSFDAEYTLAQHTNEYFINHPTWPTEWILHTGLLFYYDYLYSGETQYLAKHYKMLQNKSLVDLEQSNGLISTRTGDVDDEFMRSIGFSNTRKKLKDIVDWPLVERDGYDMVKYNTVVNAFYYKNLTLMSEISLVLDKQAEADFYQSKADKMKLLFNESFFDEATGLYLDGLKTDHSSLHANMFALAFDLVPADKVPAVLAFIKSKGMACSVYGAQYLLEALCKYGESDYALQLMSSTEGDRQWWNMIESGSTMALEAWDAKYKPNLDWNHAWGTAPANIITRYIWGVMPAEASFSSVVITPQLSSLDYSTIKVPTLQGAIEAEYHRSNNVEEYSIIIPESMTGTFQLQGDQKRKVSCNGKRVKGNVLTLAPGDNLIVIKN